MAVGPEIFRRRFQAALDLVQAGDLGGAAAACDGLMRMAGDDAGVLQLRAIIQLRTGRAREAWETIGRGIALRAGHVPSLILAGHAALAAGLAAEAVGPLREAVARAPERPEPAFLLCRALVEVGDPLVDKALAWAVEKHPGQSAAWQRLGSELQSAGRPLAALAAFTQAVTVDANLAGAWFGRGLVLRDVGRMGDAAAALERAVAVDPGLSRAWFALGLSRQDLNDEAGAAEAFQAALGARGDFAEAAVNWGIALQRLGRMEVAMQAYRMAFQIRPDTLSRIAQAVTSSSTGTLWLSPAALRQVLSASAGTSS